MRHWLAEIITAVAATVCLLFFFFPQQPSDLVAVEGREEYGNWLVKEDIFPASGLLLGMSYRCLRLYGQPTKYLIDFVLPGNYDSGESLRLWIRAKDLQRLADPDRKVRVHAIDFQDPNTHRWTHCVAQHPHGHGSLFALGILLAILFVVMVVNKVFFDPASKQWE